MRDCLVGHPDGVGQEAVVRQGRYVSVADGDPWRGRRVANDCDLKTLFEEMTKMGLHTQVGSHSGKHDLRDATLSQLQRQVVGLRAKYLVWRDDNRRPIEDKLLEHLEEIGTGARQAVDSQGPRAFEHVKFIEEPLGWAAEPPFPVGRV
ncbi:MAG TPA: hypothetical protein VEJ84_08080, partial [Acidimicrobiales bacterium]|nr:hypothetical protein [Acidimicrobiales bacterium]